MPITIGTQDGYWFALLEQRRIVEIFHDGQIIARAFYAEEGPRAPSAIFNRVIDRHRARGPQLAHMPAPLNEHDI